MLLSKNWGTMEFTTTAGNTAGNYMSVVLELQFLWLKVGGIVISSSVAAPQIP